MARWLHHKYNLSTHYPRPQIFAFLLGVLVKKILIWICCERFIAWDDVSKSTTGCIIMFTPQDLDKARSVHLSAFRVSNLCDAMSLHQLMDQLCFEKVEIVTKTAYDDNNDYTYHELANAVFDDVKLTEKGGLKYLQEFLETTFGINIFEIVQGETLDDLKSFINSSEFLESQSINDMCLDLGEVERFNQHREHVNIHELSDEINKCLSVDVPSIVEKLQGIVA